MKAHHDATAAIPGSEDEVDYLLSMRGGVTHLFTSLEAYLKQLLAFLTWSLMSDHYKDENPFRYTVGKALSFANHMLLSSAGADGDIESLTLRPLINQYRHLYNLLDSSDVDNNSKRPEGDYPSFTGKTTLQLFPFGRGLRTFSWRLFRPLAWSGEPRLDVLFSVFMLPSARIRVGTCIRVWNGYASDCSTVRCI